MLLEYMICRHVTEDVIVASLVFYLAGNVDDASTRQTGRLCNLHRGDNKRTQVC